MPKFNTRDNRTTHTATGPLTVGKTWQEAMGDPAPAVVNHQGGAGWTRDAKSDLYLLATTSHDLTADTFYEAGDARVDRFDAAVREVAVADPGWMYGFLTWLRTKGNIRTAAVVGGIEAARAMAEAGIPGGRHMVSTVLRRADEPGEAIAYHHARHGRKLPMPVKRGVADAAARLYTERSVLKYDTASHGVRFADVLALTHAAPLADRAHWQGPLFGYIVDRRYGRDEDVTGNLTTIAAHRAMRDRWAASEGGHDPFLGSIAPEALADAGMTWEDVLSALGNKVDKAALWRALIPSMGFMARLRNLRNFDQARLSDADVADVVRMLTDPDEVARSKQLPLRFLSAYRAAGDSLRWGYPLTKALDAAVANIPAVGGRTLILVDTSGSMNARMSDRSDLLRWDAAASFGIALAKRCQNVDIVSYSNSYYGADRASKVFDLRPGAALLAEIERWKSGGWFLNGGTDTVGAVRQYFNGHDRVVILTDEQDGGFYTAVRGAAPVGDALPATTPLYTYNLAGYATSHAPTSPYRITLGGLTDAMFSVIRQVESGSDGVWPWEGDPDIGSLPHYEQAAGATTRADRR